MPEHNHLNGHDQRASHRHSGTLGEREPGLDADVRVSLGQRRVVKALGAGTRSGASGSEVGSMDVGQPDDEMGRLRPRNPWLPGSSFLPW